MNNEFKENAIINLTFEFALKIIDFCDGLDGIKKYKLSDQLFKSGTSIGANAREAQNAESKADFIHKFKISAKEVEETEYWLCFPVTISLIPRIEQLQEINILT